MVFPKVSASKLLEWVVVSENSRSSFEGELLWTLTFFEDSDEIGLTSPVEMSNCLERYIKKIKLIEMLL